MPSDIITNRQCNFWIIDVSVSTLALQIKLGTVDQTEAQNEWVLRPYMNTTKKRKFIGDWHEPQELISNFVPSFLLCLGNFGIKYMHEPFYICSCWSYFPIEWVDVYLCSLEHFKPLTKTFTRPCQLFFFWIRGDFRISATNDDRMAWKIENKCPWQYWSEKETGMINFQHRVWWDDIPEFQGTRNIMNEREKNQRCSTKRLQMTGSDFNS